MALVDRIILNPNALEEPYDSFWVMDNHKWAYYAWLTSAQRHKPYRKYALIHADFHYDGCNDFRDRADIAWLRSSPSLDEIRRVTQTLKLIRDDSFIAPAVITGLVKEIYYLCLQDDVELGLDNGLVKKHGAMQCFCKAPSELAETATTLPMIFDLDLDLFNKSQYEEEGDLWADGEILACLSEVSHLVRDAAIVTVAVSTRCCGLPNDAIHLANLVLPRLLALRGLANDV